MLRSTEARHACHEQAHQQFATSIWSNSAEIRVNDILRVASKVSAISPDRSKACTTQKGLKPCHGIIDYGVNGAGAMECPSSMQARFETNPLLLDRLLQRLDS
eukprot:CAMPEP_0169376538 /NCGR_PEP_ID=MMETSP1017-20121227/38718_1 /TAXON_ID=342587 /ORGANISM="Karlodinium micrum, Strain CCMP2283" /LENGTH=102 /DNA_ID=CAMNT_0009475577 /DNA_START=185 /DNA_END=493 /DNA_ORIENTATION=+